MAIWQLLVVSIPWLQDKLSFLPRPSYSPQCFTPIPLCPLNSFSRLCPVDSSSASEKNSISMSPFILIAIFMFAQFYEFFDSAFSNCVACNISEREGATPRALTLFAFSTRTKAENFFYNKNPTASPFVCNFCS